MERKAQDQDKFIVRLPHGMRDRIKAAADANNRSMNAEIVATLEEAYPTPEPDDFELRWKQSDDLLREMDVILEDYKVARTQDEIESLNRRFADLQKRHGALFEPK